MIKEVVTIEDIFAGKVRVKFEEKTSCSGCSAESICGGGRGSLEIDREGFSLKKGDQVEIAIDEKKSLLASVLTFLVPAVIFVVSLVGFRAKGEIISFLIALGVIGIYYTVFKLILKKKGKKFNLRILRKL